MTTHTTQELYEAAARADVEDEVKANYALFLATQKIARRYEVALREIIRREARSEYSSIYAAPGEFAQIARDALK
jgi:hypothetical protein